MSKLYIRTTYAGIFALNCTEFSSPMFGTMMGAQTRTEMVYFPIKVQQPDIEFTVVFANINDYLGFQAFARVTQVNGLHNNLEPGITMWWPERNILNWTGVIRNFIGGLNRFTYAPMAKFTVDLVDSFTSVRTQIASTAPIFDTIYGWGIPDGVMVLPGGTTAPTVSQTGGALVPQGS